MSDATNILLVDDEPGMLRYIRTLLEVDDYKVETATTGEEAVTRVQKGLQPDLVLLDLLMPGIDGLQTLEQLRELQPAVKVVMLSCVSDTRKVVQAMRLGAQDYLTKPFQKAELDAVINQCLASTQQTHGGEIEEHVLPRNMAFMPVQDGQRLAHRPVVDAALDRAREAGEESQPRRVLHRLDEIAPAVDPRPGSAVD